MGFPHSSHQFAIARRLTISVSNPTACPSSPQMRATRCGVHSLIPIDLQVCPLSFPDRSFPQPDAPPFVQQPVQIVSGGVMRQSTASGPPYLHEKTKSTSSMRLDMNTRLTNIARERINHGRVGRCRPVTGPIHENCRVHCPVRGRSIL